MWAVFVWIFVVSKQYILSFKNAYHVTFGFRNFSFLYIFCLIFSHTSITAFSSSVNTMVTFLLSVNPTCSGFEI